MHLIKELPEGTTVTVTQRPDNLGDGVEILVGQNLVVTRICTVQASSADRQDH